MTENTPPDTTAAPLIAHVVEFRSRVITSLLAILAGFAVCFFFAPDIYNFLAEPLAKASGGTSRRMITTGLTEAFMTYIKLSLWGGCIIAFPIIAGQVWSFVAPGLYKTEKQAFLPFLLATPVLFIAGAALAYYLVFPTAWAFFLSFEVMPGTAAMPIQMEARMSEYLSLAMTIIFAFGLSFQLPILLTLMARVGLTTSLKLSQFRRFAIVLIFSFAAVITPPDVFSQIALAVPLMILYELSILGAKWAEKKRGD